MDLLAQSARQARIADKLGNLLHEARTAVDTTWGSR